MKILINRYLLICTLILFVKISSASSVDNILNTFFYSQNDSTYLILHESIFHPTSGSYEKGNLRAQGYNSSRISVYNIINGKLIAQKNMGVIDSAEYCLLLGCSQNNLWLYSRKHKSGLQSLNPLTLKSNISQAKLYNTIYPSIGRFANTKWQTIIQNYGFDAIQKKLIVTNKNNDKYYIDVETFSTQKITEHINLNIHNNNYFSETVVYNNSVWSLDGYKKTYLRCGKLTVSKPSFLYGKFILQQNTNQLFNHFLSIQNKLKTNDTNSNSIDSLNNSSKNNIKNLIIGEPTDEVLLQTDTNSIYIFSKSNDKPDAFIKITKLQTEQFGHFSVKWATSIPGMFYNIAQARNTKIFKQYFGNITPEFEYHFFQILNSKLIVIYLSNI